MQHVAIMKKSWGLTEKIINGTKTIESRWYTTKRAPFGKIKKGDVVYFKNAGEPVALRANVSKVEQYSDLTPQKVGEILAKYGKDDGIDRKDLEKFHFLFKDKKHCIIVFLKGANPVKPFHIDKKGYGTMSAWLCIRDVSEIRR